MILVEASASSWDLTLKTPFSEAYSFHYQKLEIYVTKKEVFPPFFSHSLDKYFQKGKHMK